MVSEATHVPEEVLEEIRVENLPRMPLPCGVLMCPPDSFDVVDVKNPFMRNQQGKVDRALARREWEDLKAVFQRLGVNVCSDSPVPGCEDMVFCANPIFTGLDAGGQCVCVLSHMRFASRQREVAAHEAWFRANGYRVVIIDSPLLFEGGGDAIWHPGRRLIWGGCGRRTDAEIYDEIAQVLDAPVIALELKTDVFYHLDTCFCPIDERTALLYPPAISSEGVEEIHRMFERIIEVDEGEATNSMACNSTSVFAKSVVMPAGAPKTARALRELGFEVVEVNTSEFIKSGGSVYCMKTYLW
jgi:N-dimethylarginine dimethylaminohydrolase